MMFAMRVTAKLVVARRLSGPEDLFRSEMSFQMDPSELTLQRRDFDDEFPHREIVGTLLREDFIQTALSLDDLFTNLARPAFHFLKDQSHS